MGSPIRSMFCKLQVILRQIYSPKVLQIYKQLGIYWLFSQSPMLSKHFNISNLYKKNRNILLEKIGKVDYWQPK